MEICAIIGVDRQFGYKSGSMPGLNSVEGLWKTTFDGAGQGCCTISVYIFSIVLPSERCFCVIERTFGTSIRVLKRIYPPVVAICREGRRRSRRRTKEILQNFWEIMVICQKQSAKKRSILEMGDIKDITKLIKLIDGNKATNGNILL